MELTKRLNILIQAVILSQKKGILTLEDAVKAKNAIDIISIGEMNQNFTSAINILIEIIVSSQKKGIYSLKDAYMIYLAIYDIEDKLQNKVNKINTEEVQKDIINPNVLNNDETIVTIPPVVLTNNKKKET